MIFAYTSGSAPPVRENYDTVSARRYIIIITVASDRDSDSDSEDCYILVVLLWPPYVVGQAIIFLPYGFYLLSSFFFFFLA